MFRKNSPGQLADKLNVLRISRCCYGASETGRCDCKYGYDFNLPRPKYAGSEQTGCPELREAVLELRRLQRFIEEGVIDQDPGGSWL